MSADDSSPAQPHRRRSPGRFLAPGALIAVVVVIVVIVAGAGGAAGTGTTTATPAHVATSVSRRPAKHGSKRRAAAGTTTASAAGGTSTGTGTTGTGTSSTGAVTSTVSTYTVRSGDTFAAISAATGVPVATLEALNPGVSSSNLSIGQVLKLR